MEWNFDNTKNEWNLVEGGETLYKIKTVSKPENSANKFIVKLYYSTFIAGKKKTKAAEAKNKVWLKDKVIKFKAAFECENYIARKKIELTKKVSDFF